jgi:alcohol dehydrogenase
MQSFDYSQRTRFVFGAGKLDQLGKLARELGASRVLLVSDAGVVQAGHFARGRERLEEAGLVTAAFHDLQENPTTRHVESGLMVARDFRPDLLVGLGGGSSMDCAKGINVLYSCGGQMKDYWGVGKATGPLLPMIAVPTTAGTGSEAQSFALISDAETHVKMACGDPRAACRIALLDPELTLTQPPRVTALTGVDALTHALETLVTRRRTAVSLAFSRQAWQLIANSLRLVIERPEDLEARGCMQVGAAMAGMAIEASMLGAAHALANPLTARFQIAHGQAVGLMLPHVIRFNGQEASTQAAYRQAALDIGLASDEASESLARWITEQLTLAGLKTRLDELQVPPEAIGELAQDAARQWTASFNPRAVDEENLRALYAAAFRA